MVNVLLLLILLISNCFCAPPTNFSAAKKIAQTLFKPYHKTLYCQCDYGSDKKISLASCHMESAIHHRRAHYLEWEHIVPASKLATDHACWTKNLCKTKKGKKYHGRKCCEAIDKNFKLAESELYNLWPASGLINQLRKNYEYTALTFTDYKFGCKFIIDKAHHQIEPSDQAKGIVARASLYIYQKNHLKLAKQQQTLFELWDLLYPPTNTEIKWAKQVAQIEGYDNPFIKKYYA